MKGKGHFFLLAFVVFVAIFFLTISTISVDARKHHVKKEKPHKHQKGKSRNGTANSPAPAPSSRIFNVFTFGAKGDGVTDDSKAFLATWKAACNASDATIEVPADYKFLLKSVTLQGPCMPNLSLQIDGTLLAPPKISSWTKYSLFQWINFKWVHDFTIQGTGIVDGQGSQWWTASVNPEKFNHLPNMKPTALRFYASSNVTVRDINITNSPNCHLKFDSSNGIKVNNITISSPESSPNTDGIHLQNTQDVEIHHSNIGCGDDCVSIQTGCSNIHVHHINCGPGHGISLGGLGKGKSIACVSDIIIEEISLQNTFAGVRIKTWQGGMGSVKNVTFSNIQVFNVKVPIIIDQFYCDKNICKNQTGAVAISGVKYDQIIGTYSAQPVHLACSNSVPCTDVDLIDIQLRPAMGIQGFKQALCWNSYGKYRAPLLPSSIYSCLRKDSSWVKRIARSSDHHVCDNY